MTSRVLPNGHKHGQNGSSHHLIIGYINKLLRTRSRLPCSHSDSNDTELYHRCSFMLRNPVALAPMAEMSQVGQREPLLSGWNELLQKGHVVVGLPR
jgi:hypothetical protein